MFKRSILALVLCSAFVGSSVFAKPTQTTAPMSELAKCNQFKNYQIKVAVCAAYLASWVVGYQVTKRMMVPVLAGAVGLDIGDLSRVHDKIRRGVSRNKLSNAELKAMTANAAMFAALVVIHIASAIIMHKAFLEKQDISKLATFVLTPAGPVGLGFYGLCNSLISQLDASQMRACLKQEIDKLMEEV